MAYCPNCGAKGTSEARFCSSCGHSLRPVDEPEGAAGVSPAPSPVHPPETAVARTLDDVPGWLGWLGVLTGLTLIGFPIYCYWAYRRGRRHGVGWEPAEGPYGDFGWRVIGWMAAAILLPIIDWYVFVHVPTLCYKHGLRVGAKDGTAPLGFTSLTALAVAVLMAGIAVLVVGSVVLGGLAVALSTDSESESPPIVPNRTEAPATPSGPFLTGAEAAAKAEGTLRQAVAKTGRQDLSYACDAEDYNSRTHQWIVGCLVSGPQNVIHFRFTVDDRFGAVRMVE